MNQLHGGSGFIYFLSAASPTEHKALLQVLFIQAQSLHSTLHTFPS